MTTVYLILNSINRALFNRSVLSEKGAVDDSLLYVISKKHSIANLVWEGLHRSGRKVIPEVEQKFLLQQQALAFQYLRQTQELHRLTAALEQAKMPYIVLKGSVMRNFYPSPELRSSCDIDLLLQEPDEKVHELMQSLQYTFSCDGGTTLNYVLPPAIEVEMHRRLFDDALDFKGYFVDIWKRSVPGVGMQRFLTETDFYVYMVAHMAKHFTRYGCGVRPVIDLYLYQQKLPETFDRSEVDECLQRIGLLDFERRLLALAKAWFETGNLSQTDKNLTDYIFGSSIYGNRRITNARTVKDPKEAKKAMRSKKLFVLFPPMHIMQPQYPRLLKSKALLPVAWTVRGFRVFTKRGKNMNQNIKTFDSVDEAYVAHVSSMIRELGLE